MATDATQPATVQAPASEAKSDAPAQPLPNHKLKIKLPLQRSCNEKDEKGKICGGHLKRWFYAVDSVERACGDIERAWGKNAELYRCRHCRTLYLPNPQAPKGPNVAGFGQVSAWGFPTAPKADKPEV